MPYEQEAFDGALCCLLTKGLRSIIPGQEGLLPLGEVLPISMMSPAFTGHQTRQTVCHEAAMLMTGGHPEMGVVERALDVRKKRGH